VQLYNWTRQGQTNPGAFNFKMQALGQTEDYLMIFYGLTPGGNVHYQLKTPYRGGTTHVIFEPLDFIARLAALIHRPRANLTRFHGVFAPNSKHRALVTPSRRGKNTHRQINSNVRSPVERHAAMSWAQHVIKQILSHLERKAVSRNSRSLPESRAPQPTRLPS